MIITLKDTLGNSKKEHYIETDVFDREIEEYFIELYYRDIVEGLIDTVGHKDVKDEDVYDIDSYLEEKEKVVKSKRGKKLIRFVKERVKGMR